MGTRTFTLTEKQLKMLLCLVRSKLDAEREMHFAKGHSRLDEILELRELSGILTIVLT
jgi:hypothetical protein